MRGKWIAVLCLGLFLSIVNYSTAQPAKEVTCSGKVVDTDGKPVTGAKVSLYKLIVYMETMPSRRLRMTMELSLSRLPQGAVI